VNDKNDWLALRHLQKNLKSDLKEDRVLIIATSNQWTKKPTKVCLKIRERPDPGSTPQQVSGVRIRWLGSVTRRTANRTYTPPPGICSAHSPLGDCETVHCTINFRAITTARRHSTATYKGSSPAVLRLRRDGEIEDLFIETSASGAQQTRTERCGERRHRWSCFYDCRWEVDDQLFAGGTTSNDHEHQMATAIRLCAVSRKTNSSTMEEQR